MLSLITKKMGFNKYDFPEAENYYANAISIPIFSGLNHDDQDKVINSLREIING